MPSVHTEHGNFQESSPGLSWKERFECWLLFYLVYCDIVYKKICMECMDMLSLKFCLMVFKFVLKIMQILFMEGLYFDGPKHQLSLLLNDYMYIPPEFQLA